MTAEQHAYTATWQSTGLPGKLRSYTLASARMMHVKYRLANLVCGLLPDFASGAVRSRLYRLAGFDIPADAFIMGNLRLASGGEGFYQKLRMGSGVVIGDNVTINLDADVKLGNNVSLGPRVLIYTGTHQIGPGSRRRIGPVVGRRVTIEDGCWVGLAAIILAGVTVGHGSIVAAGAVVTQDVPPDSFVEGNPARVVRKLPLGDR